TPEFSDCIAPVCHDVIATGIAVIEREVQSATPALPGIPRDWLVSFHPLKQPNGTVLGISMVVSDVTERKRFNDELMRHEAQLRLVIDAMPGLVGYIDRDYRYQFTNHGYSEWFRRPISDFEGKTVEDVMGAEVFGEVKEHLDRALRGEAIVFERQVAYA